MIIEEFLPVYDVVERHCIEIHAPQDAVYRAARALDLKESSLVRWLFRLRELPARLGRKQESNNPLGLNMDGLLRSGFILLAENPPHEFVLGLVGRFWTAAGDIQRLDADGYHHFSQPGYAKAAWNFSLSSRTPSVTHLATETRVHCLDEMSRQRFRRYWIFIRPFSGLIRRAGLRAIKRHTDPSAAITIAYK
ncbi:MAG: hypothetical protein HY232_20525 [Acidobacteria bacterium]|nr:hypothetical protein [Acidobacteriota bacterium]